MKGRLIVIEGLDGAGKAVQTKLLTEALQKAGKTVTLFDFPRYTTSLFGKLTGEALQGLHGDFRNMSPYLSSLPYVLDRSTAKSDIEKALTKGDVICNRYTTSNLAYQSAKLPPSQRKKFIDFIEKAEYGEIGLPKPDAVIYLNVSVETALGLNAQKPKRVYMKKMGDKDQHDEDEMYQKQVFEVYLNFAKEKKGWHLVECIEGEKLLSPEAIHAKIMAILQEKE
jgi:dTMP kinase